LRHYSIKIVLKRVATVGILSAIVPVAVFYLCPPNCLRFIATSKGADEPVWFYLTTLLWGLCPWIVYLLFSVFDISPSAAERRRKKENRPAVIATETEQKVYLYAVIVIAVALVGFSVLPAKKEASICLIYPFISLFIARYITFLTEYRTRVTRIFGEALLLISVLFSIGFVGVRFNLFSLSEIAWSIGNAGVITVAELVQRSFAEPSPLNWALFSVLLFAQITLIYQLGKKVNIKILYSCIGLYLALVVFFYLTLFLHL
jgi:4-amino-4-deoxy-L-arabinose transferase-like glycosyltransferase